MRNVHITEYSVSGIGCHEGELTLSFFKDNSTNYEDTTKYNTKGVFGETASGKSSYIKSLYILKLLLTVPEYLSSEEGQEMMRKVVNKKCGFMRFFVKFLYREGEKIKQCEYGLAVGQENGKYEIVAENIGIENPSIRITPVNNSETSVAQAFYSGGSITPEKEQMQKDLLPLKMLADSIHIFPFESPEMFKSHIAKPEYTHNLAEFLRTFNRNVVDAKAEGSDISSLSVIYPDYEISFSEESAKMQKLIKLYPFLVKASEGGIVFVDDLDECMHEVYLTKFLEYMMEYGEGQLCFTADNTQLMETLKNGKESISFLTGKDETVTWKKYGNYSPAKLYREGMMPGLPFNIFPHNFINVLEKK